MVNRTQIVELLRTRDDAVGRALLAINARQTQDERQQEMTKYHNMRGFTSGDAKRGTGMANYYARFGKLTPKQLAWWRVSNAKGRSRIEKYVEQLLLVAKEKELTKQQAML